MPLTSLYSTWTFNCKSVKINDLMNQYLRGRWIWWWKYTLLRFFDLSHPKTNQINLGCDDKYYRLWCLEQTKIIKPKYGDCCVFCSCGSILFRILFYPCLIFFRRHLVHFIQQKTGDCPYLLIGMCWAKCRHAGHLYVFQSFADGVMLGGSDHPFCNFIMRSQLANIISTWVNVCDKYCKD